MLRLVFILLFLGSGFGDDTDKARDGNKRYHEKKYEEAARLFKEALASLSDDARVSHSAAITNNLGSALNRLESFDEAREAFAASLQAAQTEKDVSRAAYNAGNTTFQAQDAQAALEYYRQALLADPTSEDARFNYEFVRRMLENQEQEQDQQQSGDSQQDQEQEQEQESENNEEQEQQEEQERKGDEEQEDEQDQEQPEPDPEQDNDRPEMTPEQAEQILDALQNDEEELMRQVWKMKGKPRSVEKDW